MKLTASSNEPRFNLDVSYAEMVVLQAMLGKIPGDVSYTEMVVLQALGKIPGQGRIRDITRGMFNAISAETGVSTCDLVFSGDLRPRSQDTHLLDWKG